MSFQFRNSFNLGVNLDLDELRLPPNAAIFIKNLTDNVNTNAGAPGSTGSNKEVRTPLEGNKALTISGMPSGTNYCIGWYSSEQTNEGYFAVRNSSGNHTIWVVRGDTGIVQKVHQNTLLPFSLNPELFLSEGRMTLELVPYTDPVSGDETNYKLLVFTNNDTFQGLIDVEASIDTSSYTTSYFTSSAAFYNRLELIHLGATTPIKCVKLNDPTAYTPVAADESKQNLLINAGWQFRIRTWDVWGRPSEWGIISNVYTALTGGGCIATSNGLPRCVNLCFDAGNPLVKFITVAYRRGIGNDPSGQQETGWYETETFRKYDDSTGVPWYQRPINPMFSVPGSGISFNAGTNVITYTFCADKGANPIDPIEAARTEPGLPRWSGGVFSVSKSLGLANNVRGFEPIPQDVIEDIEFSITVPETAPCDAAPLRTIVVYANLYNVYGDYSPLLRKTFDVYTFGDGNNGTGPADTSCLATNFKLGQVFGDQENPGFIAYLAGTPYKVLGEWGNYDPVGNVFTVNEMPWDGAFAFPNIKMTRFTFTGIPAGKYVVRLASHHAKITDGDLQKTSTQVWGTAMIGDSLTPYGRRDRCFDRPNKEIQVDCSTGDVDLGGVAGEMFVILDLNEPGAGAQTNGLDGYLFEEAGGAPVEMAPCFMYGRTLGSSMRAFGSFFTDHNGYYFVTSPAQQCGVKIFVDVCDELGAANVFSQTSGCVTVSGKMTHGDGTGSRDPDYWGNCGNWRNQVYVARADRYLKTFPDSGRRFIKQTIVACDDATLGVPGIPIVLTKCQPALTNSSGLATLIAHNRYNYLLATLPAAIEFAFTPEGSAEVPDYASVPGNRDELIFSQKGGCQWNGCGDCTTTLADVQVDYLACGASSSGCTPTTSTRTICLPDLEVIPAAVGIKGLQSGGKYPVAFWCHDVIGRHTAPQIRGGELGYVYAPNLNDTSPTPYPAMALCGLQVTIPAALTVDPVFTRITFLVGANCLFRDYFSWSADWVQYIDNTGATNTTNPTAIRIYFQSLNEYNKQYNFGTNVAWDFLAQGEIEGQPADIVQFIMNGDGTYLPPIKGAPVTYDKFGSFFTIAFQPELDGLQNGCLFRVVRPKQNTTGVNLPYYEQCLTLDITNGLLPAGTYTLPYHDSYLLSRSIPVPLLKGETAPVPPGGIATGIQYTSVNQNTDLATAGYSQNNVNNNNGVVIWQTVDFQTTYPFFFESPSPSDLWGSHLANRGRVGIPNPREQQYRLGTEIAMSNPISDQGLINGIGTFLSSNRQIFDRNTWGDITAVLVETSIMLVICDRDHFLVRFNGSTVRVSAQGELIAQNTYGIFTAPERKAGTNYGCGTRQINTIRKYAGIVRWLDNTGYVVIHNFSTADSNTDDAGYLGYLLNKIGIVNIANLSSLNNDNTYFMAGIDPKNYEYYLTVFNIPPLIAPSYINTESQPTLGVNETFIFDLATSRMKGFASFTPEHYGILPGYFTQRQFLSFKNGVPYIHHFNLAHDTPPAYCNFFGTQCEVRITHVVNGVDGKLLPDKVKRFLYTELYCRSNVPVVASPPVMPEALFFADLITSEKGQVSRLLIPRWTAKDGYFCAAYLCNLSTPADPNIPVQTGANAILDGDQLQGRWLKVSLTNNPLWGGTYFEISESVTYINGIEKSGD